MELIFSKYIEKTLAKATYKYDKSVKQWAVWIEDALGVYAQAPTVEEARSDLASVLEEYVLISLSEGRQIPGFALPRFSK